MPTSASIASGREVAAWIAPAHLVECHDRHPQMVGCGRDVGEGELEEAEHTLMQGAVSLQPGRLGRRDPGVRRGSSRVYIADERGEPGSRIDGKRRPAFEAKLLEKLRELGDMTPAICHSPRRQFTSLSPIDANAAAGKAPCSRLSLRARSKNTCASPNRSSCTNA